MSTYILGSSHGMVQAVYRAMIADSMMKCLRTDSETIQSEREDGWVRKRRSEKAQK